jgi:hypothetical protein
LRFVSPEVPSEEAKLILSKRGRLSVRRKGEMRKVELIYLPYYLHKVVVSQGDKEHEVVACTDGIEGGFSFFSPERMSLCREAPGEVVDFIISPEEAERSCRENLRWHVVRQGLRLKVKAEVKKVRQTQRIHYPYWVGYFKKGGQYDFRAADAVTGEIQGVRMRKVFLKAFSRVGAIADVEDSPQKARSMQR